MIERTSGLYAGVMLLAFWLNWRLRASRTPAARPAGADVIEPSVGSTLVRPAKGALEFRALPGGIGAQSSLRRSEATLRRLLMMLPEPVLVHMGGRIRFANQAAQRLFGVDEATLLNQLPTAMVHAESMGAVLARLAVLRTGAVAAPLTGVRIVRSNAEVRVVEMAGTLVEPFGEGAIIVVLRDVTDLLQARSEVAASHAELQRLLAARERIQEEERRRIARELHDDLQQMLAAVRIDVKAAAQRYPQSPEAKSLLDEVDQLAATAIESTRRIINDLRPQMLEDLGLLPALEALVGQFRRSSGIECRLRVNEEPGEDEPISSQVATCLYRVTQEGLRNVARHAHASEVEVRFARMERGLILLRIVDNGRGMQTDQPRSAECFGLMGMRERVRALGALLRIDSRIGVGTTIEVVVPAVIATLAPTLGNTEARR